MDDLKVGEVARRTGLTVRTLHHYDQIGLLAPSERTDKGHRLYGRAQMERLQQIASLRHLGLSLEEIKGCLDRPEYTLEHVLDLHLDRLEEEIGRQRRIHGLVRSLRDRLRSAESPSVDDLTRTIEVTMNFEKYYSPEQLEQLAERREEVGEERIAQVQQEWADLFDAYGRAMEEGLDPASPSVQALAKKSEALIGEFTGGDPGIRKSLSTMYQAEGGANVVKGYGMSMAPGLWEYMAKAKEALGRSDG